MFLKQIVEQCNPVRFSFMARRVMERIICLTQSGHLSEFLLRISVNVIEFSGPWLFSFPILRDGTRNRSTSRHPILGFSTRFYSGHPFQLHRPGRGLIVLVNPLVRNGLSHPYHLDESTFILRDIRNTFSCFFVVR